MLTPNKYPTIAVSPIATVPQKVIRTIALLTLEPPVLAAKRQGNQLKKQQEPSDVVAASILSYTLVSPISLPRVPSPASRFLLTVFTLSFA